jgi:hypothetical protein
MHSRRLDCPIYGINDVVFRKDFIEKADVSKRSRIVLVKAAIAMRMFLEDVDARVLLLHADDSMLCKWSWLCLCLWRRLYLSSWGDNPFLGRLTVTMWCNYYDTMTDIEFGEYPDEGVSCQFIAMNRAACVECLSKNKHFTDQSMDAFSCTLADDRWCIYPHLAQHGSLKSTLSSFPRSKARYFSYTYVPAIPAWMKSMIQTDEDCILFASALAVAYLPFINIPSWSRKRNELVDIARKVLSLYKYTESECQVDDNWNLAVSDTIMACPEWPSVMVLENNAKCVVEEYGWTEVKRFNNGVVLVNWE